MRADGVTNNHVGPQKVIHAKQLMVLFLAGILEELTFLSLLMFLTHRTS